MVETEMQYNQHSKSNSNAWMIDQHVERWVAWLLSGCNGKWITTRCMMMHSWPHKNGEHSDGKDLGLTDWGLWCKTKWMEQ